MHTAYSALARLFAVILGWPSLLASWALEEAALPSRRALLGQLRLKEIWATRLVAIVLLVLSSACAALAAAKPNVIVILSDDQGYGDFSIHGNPVLKTPNL